MLYVYFETILSCLCFKKGGDLIKFFNQEGVRATEDLLKEQIPLLLYRKGEGQMVTRVDYLKWKYRGKGQVTFFPFRKALLLHQNTQESCG